MRVKLDSLCHQFATQIKCLSDFWDDDTAFTSCFASCLKLINKYILCCVAISFFSGLLNPTDQHWYLSHGGTKLVQKLAPSPNKYINAFHLI